MKTKVIGIVVFDDMPQCVEALLINGVVYVRSKEYLNLILEMLGG